MAHPVRDCKIRPNKQLQTPHQENSKALPNTGALRKVHINREPPTSSDHATTTINISRSTSIPSITILTKGLKSPTHMMIDTGAARNSINQKVLNPEVPINNRNVLRLTGINNFPLYTLGQVEINIFAYPTTFNIISNEVPVEEDGVLGSEFFQDNSINTNYTSKCLEIENHSYPFKSTNTFTIPAQTFTTFLCQYKKYRKE